MDLSDLKIFRTVVEEGGITRAAEKLLRVQSNITTRIKQLEADLGTELFIREGKRLHLAPAGQVLLGYAERLADLAAEARQAVQLDRPVGLFRLGAMESTAAVRLPGPLAEFGRLYPDVDIQLTTGNPTQLATAVLAGEIDAALVAEPIAEASIEQAVAFEEELVLVAKRDHPTITLNQPPPDTVIVFEQGCPHRMRLDRWYEKSGHLPRQTVQIGSYHALLGCVAAGMGVALVPKSVLETFPNRDQTSTHDLPKGLDRFATLLVWRKQAGSPKIDALCDVLGISR